MMKEPTFLKLDIWTFICHDSNNSWNQVPMDIAHVLFNSISFISRRWRGWYDTSRAVLYNQCKPNPREISLFFILPISEMGFLSQAKDSDFLVRYAGKRGRSFSGSLETQTELCNVFRILILIIDALFFGVFFFFFFFSFQVNTYIHARSTTIKTDPLELCILL